VKKIVKRHDWTIKVLDNSGKGSIFILEIKKYTP
jgi:signal transduction histidine kinase